ncbi:MAG: NUDIX domain-containing protein [Patescibacteria group bacterium]
MSQSTTIIPCAGCAIIEDGKLLLLLKREHHHYEFPGGQVEPGETLEQAARREVKEEAGCEVEITKYFGYSDMTFARAKGKIYRGHVFLAERKPGETVRLADPIEHEKIIWVPFAEYRKQPLAPNVKEFCKRYLAE